MNNDSRPFLASKKGVEGRISHIFLWTWFMEEHNDGSSLVGKILVFGRICGVGMKSSSISS